MRESKSRIATVFYERTWREWGWWAAGERVGDDELSQNATLAVTSPSSIRARDRSYADSVDGGRARGSVSACAGVRERERGGEKNFDSEWLLADSRSLAKMTLFSGSRASAMRWPPPPADAAQFTGVITLSLTSTCVASHSLPKYTILVERKDRRELRASNFRLIYLIHFLTPNSDFRSTFQLHPSPTPQAAISVRRRRGKTDKFYKELRIFTSNAVLRNVSSAAFKFALDFRIRPLPYFLGSLHPVKK